MEENQERRPRRTLEERVADIDAKIQARWNEISALQEKKAESAAMFDEKIEKVKEKIDALETQKKYLTATIEKKAPDRKATLGRVAHQGQKGGTQTERGC